MLMERGDDVRDQLGLQKWEEGGRELVLLMSSAGMVDSGRDEDERTDGRAVSLG